MSGPQRVALVPGVLALLPAYAGLVDPVAEVRAAARTAAAWLAELGGPVEVVADEQGARVGRHLLAEAGAAVGGSGSADAAAYLVVANGSARRDEHAPGYVDERAVPFDGAVEAALRGPDLAALADIDTAVAAQLLVGGVDGWAAGSPPSCAGPDPRWWTMPTTRTECSTG